MLYNLLTFPNTWSFYRETYSPGWGLIWMWGLTSQTCCLGRGDFRGEGLFEYGGLIDMVCTTWEIRSYPNIRRGLLDAEVGCKTFLQLATVKGFLPFSVTFCKKSRNSPSEFSEPCLMSEKNKQKASSRLHSAKNHAIHLQSSVNLPWCREKLWVPSIRERYTCTIGKLLQNTRPTVKKIAGAWLSRPTRGVGRAAHALGHMWG